MSDLRTIGDYDAREVVSALQKCIRRNLDEDALFWAVQLERSGYGAWLWKRLRIIAMEDVGLADAPVIAEVDALHRTYVDLKRNKNDHQRPWRLCVVQAVLLLARAPKSRLVDWALIAAYGDALDHRPIPDVALDRHTARGRRMGRDTEHFMVEGTRLEPHAEQIDEDRYRALAAAVLEGDGLLDDEPMEQTIHAQQALDLEAR